MECPKCKAKMKCKDTRHGKDEMYRLYRCDNCGNVVYTVEFVVEFYGDFLERWDQASRWRKKT